MVWEPDTRVFARGTLILGVSHTARTERASGAGDGGGEIEYEIFYCEPGAAVTVLEADMFVTSAGSPHPSWAFYDAAWDRVDIVGGMDPVPVTGTLYVCSTESGDRVLAIVPEN